MRTLFTPVIIAFWLNLSILTVINAQTPLCDVFTWLQCGDSLVNESTQGTGIDYNIVNSYPCLQQFGSGLHGPDKLYKINITQPAGLRFVLDILNGADLDMLLFSSCGPFPQSCQYSYENNQATGIYREVLDVYLPNPGTYYLVVDGKDISGFGNYNLFVDCDCDYIEPTNNPPLGQAIFCDDFENYIANQPIDPQSTRWELWDSLAADAKVTPSGYSGNGARIQTAGADNPRVLYDLNYRDLVNGRYRLSWKMNVTAGKKARYNFMHRSPASTPPINWAYHVFFNTAGTAELRVANPANAPIATFNYPQDVWFNVVNIVDLDKDSAELYINNNFIAKWKFSAGWTGSQNFNLKRVGAIEFVAANNTDFRIDNICMWIKTDDCTGGSGPVCVKNGVTYPTADEARCDLYTSGEWNLCKVTTVCDFGGTFINRSDRFVGTLDVSDLAPTSLLTYPEIIDAYNGNPPQPLYADIYIFSQNTISGGSISWGTSSTDPSFRRFAFACKSCSYSLPPFDDCIPDSCNKRGEVLWYPDWVGNIPRNNCSDLYYLVVMGSLGVTYSTNVVDSWFCPEPMDNILECNTTVSGNFSTSTGSVSPPSMICYNGLRDYPHWKNEFYRFTLDQPNEVTFELSSQDSMGIFLFSFMCGENCVGYAENSPPINESGKLTATLSEGTYYLMVSSQSGGDNNPYQISVNCRQYSAFVDEQTFVSGNFPACPTDPSAQHQVGIAPSPTYAPSDYFNFYFRNTDGQLKGNLEASQYWHNANQTQYFNLKADQSGDPAKCSFLPGDTFYVFMHQTENGRRTFKQFSPNFSTGNPVVFQSGASSLITGLNEEEVVNFGAETSFIRTRAGSGVYPMRFSTNKKWAIERVNNSAPWLTINPESDDGSETIDLIFEENPSPLPRGVVLRFYSTNASDLYRQFVRVEQQGQCVIPQPVNIVPSATSVCAGVPLTLTADVGAPYLHLYNYKWSTGDTTPAITKMPNTSTTYAVTVTNKYCFITSVDAQAITVNPRPNAPANPAGATMCAGQPAAPPLSVTPPGGNLQVFWFADAAGGQPLSPNPSNLYAPAPPPAVTTTYYAETRNPVTACVSAVRTPLVLTVIPPPVITLNETTCSPSLETYTIVATVTDGNTLTTNPVFPVPPPNGNVYNIPDIPTGTDLTLTTSNAACSVILDVTSPECLCPVVIPPVSGGDKNYCRGETPPTLTASVGAGETADWYDQLSGGTLLAMSTLTFTPTGPGTYYVNARNLTNNCVSERIAITLTLNSVNTPVSGGDKSFCPYETPPALSVTVGPNETADWYEQMNGGMPLETGTPVFVPLGPGTYFVNARNLENGCVSDRIAVALTLNAIPAFSVVSKSCSDDLKTYTVRVVTNADGVLAPPHSVANPMAGIFDISGIPQGQPVSIQLSSSDTGCERDTVLEAHFCFCPTLDKPVNPINVNVCAGEPNIPPLQVSAGPDLLANWYFNGQLQAGSPTLALNAAVAGDYYAKTFNPVNLCESEDSTLVTLSFKPLPALTEGIKQCNPAWTQYQVTVTSDAVNFTSTPFVVPSNNGNGTFTFSGIPVATSISITAFANGCSSAITVDPPVCSCTVLPLAPQNPNNPTICLGDNIPALSVTVTNPGAESVDWYDLPSGGIPVFTNSLQYQPQIVTSSVTYYAQAKLNQNPNCFSPRTPVSLTVNMPATANAGADAAICAGDSLTLNGAIGGSAATGAWTVTPISGKFYPNASFLQAQQYIPPPSLTGGMLTLTLTAFPAAPSVCPQVNDQMVLTVHPRPVVTILENDCEPDLARYFIQFTTAGDQLTFTPELGELTANPDGSYTYSNIPEGQQVSIAALFVGTGCNFIISPPAKECLCPTDIPKPGFIKNEQVCAGNNQFPTLAVTTPSGFTVDWYDAATGGNLLETGTPTFLPPAPGAYWAETRDLLTGCVSLQRQEVRLTEAPIPVADAGPDQYVCPGSIAQLTAVQNSGYAYQWSSGQNTPGIEAPALNATYYLTVTLGICSANDSVRVSVFPAVSATIIPDAAIRCNGGNDGQLRALPAGGTPPFGFTWSNGSSGQTIENLGAGAYTVIVTDSAGCQAESAFLLDEPPALFLTDTTVQNATNGSNNGSILAEIGGGTPGYQYQWLLPDNSPIPGQTQATLNAAGPGDYLLRVTDGNGCVFVAGPFTIRNIVPAAEPEWASYISIFPNPAAGKIYLRFDLPRRAEAGVEILDILGRQVLSARPGAVQSDVLEFDLSVVAAGLYLVKVNVDGVVATKKVSLKK
ncbi:MAG: T9SS type A sorting domain-containing protein [Thermoanaerobaculia bacterium]|nr:T9SS type A sorting domain-containing protein [Thermoanaerobaculia bacterium]